MNRYILSIIFSLLTVAVAIFAIEPMWNEIQQKLVREQQLTKYLADAKTAQARIDQLKAEYDAFPESANEDLGVMLPDSINPTRLIIDIEAVVNKRGLVMKGPLVTSAAKTNSSNVMAHTFSFSVEATYMTFRELLRDLEVSLALRDLGAIGFSTGGAGTQSIGNPQLFAHNYAVTFTTYSLSQ